MARFPDFRVSEQGVATTVQLRAAVRTDLIDWRAIRKADRACCCLAKPAVVAVMPPAPGRGNQTDLLLCGHHYRVSRLALRRAGALIVDINGVPLDVPEPPGHRAGTQASSASLS